MSAGQKTFTFLCPPAVQGVGGAGFFFIRAHAVQAAHKDISQYGGIGGPDKQPSADPKPGVAFDTGQVHGNDRDLLHTGFFQCPADKADIIGRTASAAGLAYDNSHFV